MTSLDEPPILSKPRLLSLLEEEPLAPWELSAQRVAAARELSINATRWHTNEPEEAPRSRDEVWKKPASSQIKAFSTQTS